MEKLKTKANDIDKEIKIRDYLKGHLGFSTSLIAKVKFGGVFINDAPVHMRAMVTPGDTVSIEYPEEDSENIDPIDIPLDIIYEDDYILAVNKPINMPVHPSRGNSLPTLASAVRAYFNHPFVFRAVNRLDRDTSGLVLIAKDPLSAAIMCRNIKDGGLEKSYLALIEGTPNPSYGTINAPIDREAENEIKRIVRDSGKESITHYSVIKSFENGDSICRITPVTGRTHQIRVHMSYIGHPLKHDFLYGTRTENITYKLHCESLKFKHPYTKVDMVLNAPCDFI